MSIYLRRIALHMKMPHYQYPSPPRKQCYIATHRVSCGFEFLSMAMRWFWRIVIDARRDGHTYLGISKQDYEVTSGTDVFNYWWRKFESASFISLFWWLLKRMSIDDDWKAASTILAALHFCRHACQNKQHALAWNAISGHHMNIDIHLF